MRWPASTGSLLAHSISCSSTTTRTPTCDDLQSILDRGWLHTGSIVVADNVKVPVRPKYREYMRQQQGTLWNTVEHKTHVEYQTLDLAIWSLRVGRTWAARRG